ncbi:L-rhamnose mutarotase [Microbacterium rhizosphaerae]|jgi:L-rhamnose mutarotase|uniref:L-rhamnose mutarotase n=1 Tax=Microbacterium rhizosphaerae TaxID=1678237 RepID=A0ABZ0SRW0_9MICO|nr:L-rhamnose mutarotase [Microbacterium rhizosphaerae]WPR90076.1 L-rhamnose mutarotase [Microbacterium rhizosphaerae]
MTGSVIYTESCTQLVPGAAVEYEAFHRAVPRRIDEQLRRGGVVAWQIYLRDDVLTHCVTKDDRAPAPPSPEDVATTAWWREQVRPFLVEGASPAVERPLGRLIWDLDWPTREEVDTAEHESDSR